MEWIKTEKRKPGFGELVLVYCSIYGRYLSTYQEIGDSGWGDWTDWEGKRGGLPPVLWAHIPALPKDLENG